MLFICSVETYSEECTFIHSIIHTFNKYILNSYTVAGTENIAVNKPIKLKKNIYIICQIVNCVMQGNIIQRRGIRNADVLVTILAMWRVTINLGRWHWLKCEGIKEWALYLSRKNMSGTGNSKIKGFEQWLCLQYSRNIKKTREQSLEVKSNGGWDHTGPCRLFKSLAFFLELEGEGTLEYMEWKMKESEYFSFLVTLVTFTIFL